VVGFAQKMGVGLCFEAFEAELKTRKTPGKWRGLHKQ
jgi:hypothetical protein